MSVSINKGLLVLVLAVFCMCFFVQTAVSDEDPALTKYLHELDRIFGSNARPRRTSLTRHRLQIKDYVSIENALSYKVRPRFGKRASLLQKLRIPYNV
ncbi:hypothetical protein QYM36_018022, partial [Artemia franciscana]